MNSTTNKQIPGIAKIIQIASAPQKVNIKHMGFNKLSTTNPENIDSAFETPEYKILENHPVTFI